MTRPRDFQRSKVYAAERKVFPSQAFDEQRTERFCSIGWSNFPEADCTHKRGGHIGKHNPDGSIVWFRVTKKKVWREGSLKTVPECQAFVDDIMAHPDWIGPTDVTVTAGQRARWATARRSPNRVVLPLWARHPWVICHEMAHHANTDGISHGPGFCAEYIKLVHRHIGFEEALKLSRAFVDGKVQVNQERLVV